MGIAISVKGPTLSRPGCANPRFTFVRGTLALSNLDRLDSYCALNPSECRNCGQSPLAESFAFQLRGCNTRSVKAAPNRTPALQRIKG